VAPAPEISAAPAKQAAPTKKTAAATEICALEGILIKASLEQSRAPRFRALVDFG
jgi:hypothetical protein